MGYDIHGLNPTRNVKEPHILAEDWLKLEGDKRDEYYEAMRENEDDNPGVYFRNNVWWWRPLWDYVCEVCEDVMHGGDIEAGHSNSGYEIDEETTSEMAEKLRIEIEQGNHKKYEEEYKKAHEELPLEDCPYCNQTGKRKWGNEEKDCNVCNTKYTREEGIPIGKRKPWASSYPFSAENVEEFTIFLEQCGGMQIC